MESLRIESLDAPEIAYVSWDLAECDPRVEGIGYDVIDFREGKVFAEWPVFDALELVDACDVRACRGCESAPKYCQCCSHCGAPPRTDCDCAFERAA